ncbi:hypothetical protein PIB30_115020, partial [Stylosanthes scabra]|nr:hypothetical protein [Stylosanthes scabra]
YLFFTRPSGRRPSSRKLGTGVSGIRKSGAPWRGDGPREASRRRRRCPRRRAYDDCVRIHWQVRSYQHKCTGSHQNSAVKRAWASV